MSVHFDWNSCLIWRKPLAQMNPFILWRSTQDLRNEPSHQDLNCFCFWFFCCCCCCFVLFLFCFCFFLCVFFFFFFVCFFVCFFFSKLMVGEFASLNNWKDERLIVGIGSGWQNFTKKMLQSIWAVLLVKIFRAFSTHARSFSKVTCLVLWLFFTLAYRLRQWTA